MGQGDSRCEQSSAARKVTEADSSSGREAGHHWPEAAVLKTTTAEAAEATRKKHATTQKIHKHYKVLGPSCLALRL